MEGLNELYRRVEICERLLYTLHVYDTPIGGKEMWNGGSVIPKYDSIKFPYQNEVLVRHNGVDYTLNYGHSSSSLKSSFMKSFKRTNEREGAIPNFTYSAWINISKHDLLFLDKTIIHPIPSERYVLDNYFKPVLKRSTDGKNYWVREINPVGFAIFINALRSDIPRDTCIDLWNEMISQLIPANPDAVETITRETINEALFETRLKIHKIKNPPYVIGTENPLLTPRMNQFMPTNSPPVTPRPHMQLVPRGNQLLYFPTRMQLVPRGNQLLSFPTRRLSRNHAMRRTKHNKNRIWGPKNSVTL